MHKRNFSLELDELLAKLKKQSLRITEPRKAILKFLIENHGPFTAEEIHTKITRRLCDLVTVYRCLANLVDLGVIKRCEFGDGTSRFELTENDNHHHHHVICNNCKKVEVLEDCELFELDRFAKKKGFSNVSHTLEFFGTCAKCS